MANFHQEGATIRGQTRTLRNIGNNRDSQGTRFFNNRLSWFDIRREPKLPDRNETEDPRARCRGVNNVISASARCPGDMLIVRAGVG
jgi:hypothetical protein